jgi:nucleoid DNA-binding protein
MTKAELQSALAEAAQTDKKTAGVFLDTLSDIAYKATKKNGEFVVPGFGKLVKQKRKARTAFTECEESSTSIAENVEVICNRSRSDRPSRWVMYPESATHLG